MFRAEEGQRQRWSKLERFRVEECQSKGIQGWEWREVQKRKVWSKEGSKVDLLGLGYTDG